MVHRLSEVSTAVLEWYLSLLKLMNAVAQPALQPPATVAQAAVAVMAQKVLQALQQAVYCIV